VVETEIAVSLFLRQTRSSSMQLAGIVLHKSRWTDW
jgi:hypothetical protein